MRNLYFAHATLMELKSVIYTHYKNMVRINKFNVKIIQALFEKMN